MRALRTRGGLWAPPACYMVLIFVLSARVDPLPQITSIVWDKALHAIEYAGLAILFCRAVRGEGAGWTESIGLAVMLSALYAASDEWHQSFVDSRAATLGDWLADLMGSVTGAAGYRVVVFTRVRGF